MIDTGIIPVGAEPPPLEPVATKVPRRPARTKDKGKTGQRFQVINAFTDFTLAKLDRAEIAVWLILWRDTQPNGLARTSQADLARRAGCNARTVRRALQSLQKAGLVLIVRQGGWNRGLSVYRVVAPLPATADVGRG
jgi:hypothetical protein